MINLKALQVYRRVLLLLKPVRGMAITLTMANLALAAVPFVEPILFGKTIDLLNQATTRGAEATLHDGVRIFSIWLLVGVGGIALGALVSLHADRLAHRLRRRYRAHLMKRYAMDESNGASWSCLKPSVAGSPGVPRWFVSSIRNKK